MAQSVKSIKLKNKHLDELTGDYLYHLGIKVSTNDANIEKQYGDVRFICMGGTQNRMLELAKYLRIILKLNQDEDLIDLCKQGHRYAVYKVGPILCCSHGIGTGSVSVILHELLKLMKYAKCNDPIFIRIGTCGGLGLKPGSVVVTELAYNAYLRNEHEIAILGKCIKRPARLDENVTKHILSCAEKNDNFDTVAGNTLTAECFYEGQGRLDGASCDYSNNEKIEFLKRCLREFNIRNIEMEATLFSSLCLHVGVKAAIVCVTLLDRLKGDQVSISIAEKQEFEQRPLGHMNKTKAIAFAQFSNKKHIAELSKSNC